MKIERKILPYLVVISAISVSLSAAFYSVTGIGKMFSGSKINVMIMMSSLEIAKLILASLLYQYWGKLNALLKTYYITAIFILMMLTSAGIYGYLSSAYSETSTKIETIAKKVAVLDLKRKIFETQLSDIRIEKQSIGSNISDLTKGLSNNVQQTVKNGKVTTTSSSSNRKTFEGQLTTSQKRRDEISLRESNLIDSISSIDMAKLELETNSDVAGDIGPLKYIARITNKSVDSVVNWFIIALMFVFDPLAVSLVIGANIIFKDKNKEQEIEEALADADEKINEFKKLESEFKIQKEKSEKDLKEIEEKKIKFESEIVERESKLTSDFDIKQKELELKISEKEKELIFSIGENKSQLEKLKIEKENLEKLKSNLSFDKEVIDSEKENLLSIKTQIEKERSELEDDKMDISLQMSKISNIQQEIQEKERNIEFIKDDMLRLEEEIKQWELQHWKLRRTPPPSAILD